MRGSQTTGQETNVKSVGTHCSTLLHLMVVFVLVGCSSNDAPTPEPGDSQQATATSRPVDSEDSPSSSGDKTTQKKGADQIVPPDAVQTGEKRYKTLIVQLNQPPSKAFLDDYNSTTNTDEKRIKLLGWQLNSISDFAPKDLLDAAREGRFFAENFPDPDKPTKFADSKLSENEIHSQIAIAEGIVLASLQFYPAKFEENKGFEPLLSIIGDRNDDWFIRYCLISSVEYDDLPQGLGPKNIHAVVRGIRSYLSHYMHQHPDKTFDLMQSIVKDSRDHPFVRTRAFQMSRHWPLAKLRAALESDANIIAYQRTKPNPIDIHMLVRDGAVTVTADTKKVLVGVRNDVKNNIAPARIILSDDSLPRFARTMLLRTLRQYHDAVIDGGLRMAIEELLMTYAIPSK